MVNLELIKKFGLYPDKHVIFGSLATNNFGKFKNNPNDLDLYTDVSPTQLKRRGLVEDKSNPAITGRFKDKDDRIDVFYDPKMFREIFPNSIVINGYRYMSYNDLLKMYKWLYENRGKEKYLVTYNWLKQHAPKKSLNN